MFGVGQSHLTLRTRAGIKYELTLCLYAMPSRPVAEYSELSHMLIVPNVTSVVDVSRGIPQIDTEYTQSLHVSTSGARRKDLLGAIGQDVISWQCTDPTVC